MVYDIKIVFICNNILIHVAFHGRFVDVLQVFLRMNVPELLFELVGGTFVLRAHSMETTYLAGAYSSMFCAVFPFPTCAVGHPSAQVLLAEFPLDFVSVATNLQSTVAVGSPERQFRHQVFARQDHRDER